MLGVMLLDQPLRRFPTADLAVPVPGTFAVHVADGDDLHPVVLEERAEVVEPLVPRADDAEGDPVAGRDPPAPPKRRGGNDRREGQPGRDPRKPRSRGNRDARGARKLAGNSSSE